MFRLATLFLVSACLVGCAASGAAPETPRTLAALESRLAGESVVVVRSDSTRLGLRRLDALGPDSLRGQQAEAPRRAVSVALRDIARLEVEPERYPSSRRRTALGLAFLPALCVAPLAIQAAEGRDSFCRTSEEAGQTALLGLGCVALGVGGALLATDRPVQEPTVILIAPLSQFTDAPREGVGVR